MSVEPPRLVVFGIGNDSRGDDALGPLCLTWLKSQLKRPNTAYIEEYQLQIENVVDLENRDLALFIDAAVNQSEALWFRPLTNDAKPTVNTHRLSPAMLLDAYVRVNGHAAPPAFVLAIAGAEFSLGAPLSSTAERHFDAAKELLLLLMAKVSCAHWQQFTSDKEATSRP